MLIGKETASGRPLFGEILVSAGKISAQQLEAALEQQETEHRYLGEILVQMGLITVQDVEGILRKQGVLR